MNDQWARQIRARLVAHWPGLGGEANDPAAKVRLEDWLRVILRCSPEVGAEALALLIETHGPFPPSIGEWQETARLVAHHHHELAATEDLLALEAGSVPSGDVAAILERCRERLASVERAPNPPPAAPASKYDPSPIHWGAEGTTMTPEEREAELKKIGGRKIRKKAS